MSRRLCETIALIFLAVPAVLPRAAALEKSRRSHERMLETLRQLAERSDVDHPYLRTRPGEGLRENVAALSPEASAPERARLEVNLGQEELRLGNLAAAIQHLEAGYRLVAEFPSEIRHAAEQSLAYDGLLAYLGLGETESCLLQHRASSCLLPIGPVAVHQKERGSRSAMPHFRRAALYENMGFGGHRLKVKLEQSQLNRAGVGACIQVGFQEDGRLRSVYRWVGTGASFGANPLTQHIGLGPAKRVQSLEVHWPTSDQTQRFSDLAAHQSIRIREGAAEFEVMPHSPIPFRRNQQEPPPAHGDHGADGGGLRPPG